MIDNADDVVYVGGFARRVMSSDQNCPFGRFWLIEYKGVVLPQPCEIKYTNKEYRLVLRHYNISLVLHGNAKFIFLPVPFTSATKNQYI